MGTSFDGLVEAENGLVSHRIFMEPEIYAQELERILARCFAVSVPRKPSPTAARLLYHLYGRRSGSGGARQRRASACLPE